jgi:hypothetical protein
MKKHYKIFTAILLSFLSVLSLTSQTVTYDNSWDHAGFNLSTATPDGIEIIYSVESFQMDATNIKGTSMKAIHLPGTLIPNNEGAPDLAGSSQYIAIPQGATASLRIVDFRTETYQDVEVAPAPRIPLDTDNGPMHYSKDESIYSVNAFYPAAPFQLSEVTSMRGVDIVMLGITPFQYNPVSKELIVYRDIRLEVNFEGGNGQFGDDRYRSRWFDPILRDHLINYSSLPTIEYSTKSGSRSDGFEYVIITPDDPVFLAWADTLKNFRTMQGISTGIYTITEVGGNNVNTIEAFIDNAYNTWTTPPLAFLIMADYGTSGNGILSPIWDNYCVSDHIFGDVNDNGMADVIMARMTAQNETHLENMIGKIINYENNPPTYESYYNPITALGWQTERWFQICSEAVGGFFKNAKGKNPIRINEVYGGNPNSDPWSTATNTSTVLNLFGPNGLDYIPATPGELGNWSGGNAADINAAINAGSFILQHRDHGYEQGWGEPSYNNNSLNGLSNEDPIFVFSINCLTGKYNWSNECFTEKFHRMEQGALGLIAASEVSYSFVNDTYVWGLFDYMWPEFLPNHGSTIDEERGMLPAFANVAAKYFLQSSSWPYNTGNKEVTYHLFHHHGCAFQSIYSEVPIDMLVLHDNVLLTGVTNFTVSADSGAFIALSHQGEILGTAESDGTPQTISIAMLLPGDVMDVVVTKQNYFRYHALVDVIPANMPYVVYNDFVINDASGNGDGKLDYGETVLLSLSLENVGLVDAIAVTADISTPNTFTSIGDNTAFFGDILSLQTATVTDEYSVTAAADIPDGEPVAFDIIATDGDSTWNSFFITIAHAPVLKYHSYTIDDAAGNGNGRIDPGETVSLSINVGNYGSSDGREVEVALACSGKGYLTVHEGPQNLGTLMPGDNADAIFTVTASDNTPGGFAAFFNVYMTGDLGISANGGFDLIIGQFSALVLDLDPVNHSGPEMMEAFNDLDLIASYATAFPEDLSMYKSVFVSLGVMFSGHELTSIESSKLVQYLNSGGRLYLEGRRTWHDDPYQPIHNKFNIEVTVDTWFEYDYITGKEGSFTEGMLFEYDASSPYNDYFLSPEGSAFSIFSSPTPDYGCAVAYDEGSYKTIGCSFEFGELVDGASPSTRQRLMLEYLSFFGDIVTGIDDNKELNTASMLNAYPNPFNEQTNISVKLEQSFDASLMIYDINGKKVATLHEGHLDAGEHVFSWDGTDSRGHKLNSGIYVYQLISNSVNATKKLILN